MSTAVLDAAPTGFRRVAVMVATVMAATVYEINISSVTVALPHMQGTFAATHDQVSWVVTAFIVGMTVMFACAGWLADRFGRKRVFVACTAGFTAASFLCGMATSIEQEVLWRFLQGALGAPLMPLSQAIVLDSFPRERHGMANAIWGIAVMVGPASGPALGGLIVEYYAWPWTFFVNVPFGVVATIATWVLLVDSGARTDRRMDWLGLITLVTAVGALQLVLNRGERLDWFDSREIVIAAIVVGLSMYLFVVNSMTTRHPFLEPQMFRDRNAVIGLMISFVWGFVLHGNLVLISLLMQELRGYPVMTLGLIMSPRGFGVMIGMLIAGQIVRHMDPRVLLGCGLSILGLSAWAMSQWTADVSSWDVLWTGGLQGIGTGLGFVPLSTMTFSTLDARYRTEGLTLFNLILFSGISSGIAVAVNILTRSININHATLSEYVSPFNELMRQPGSGGAWDPTRLSGLAALESEISRQATMIGYLNNFHLIALLSILVIPLAFMFRRIPLSPGRASGGH
jgi:DHA2 family multidrug resistance protein